MTSSLFEPLKLGNLIVPNRVFMAPLTRNRAHSDGRAKEMAATYYGQRASAGLILSEATQISEMGKGYIDTPAIQTDAQVEAWKPATAAVHANGGRIFCQLWHVGRISHSSLLPDGAQPVSSSAVRADAKTFIESGFADVSEPRAMTHDEVGQLIEQYAHAANQALRAGFDGVEIHAANGYLLDQFMQDGVNKRDDEYGGSIENRARLPLAIVDRMIKEIGSDRIGIRLSPLGEANAVSDSDPEALFTYVYQQLDAREIAYLHVVEGFQGVDFESENFAMIKRLRARWHGCYIANGGYDADMAAAKIDEGHTHAVAFGKPFIANPDLPERYRQGAALNEGNRETYYGGDAKGYTDYPFATLGRG
ncbi:alkene reductase [Pararhizobium mangrovi]|uniref:Alkene reductase n=1 Tax=Pararhizobium mangrovi TaxID=2590452 RepID=A0A506U2X5_9HYPH|nr:alkene reductase [Pararhizobium mangrovi]TPW26217.1 alkene reductase [Pararhizobium mangrovi]